MGLLPTGRDDFRAAFESPQGRRGLQAQLVGLPHQQFTQLMFLEVSPQVFHGVEFRRIRRQPFPIALGHFLETSEAGIGGRAGVLLLPVAGSVLIEVIAGRDGTVHLRELEPMSSKKGALDGSLDGNGAGWAGSATS